MTTNQKLLILCDVLKAVADVMDRKNKTADEMELFIKTVKPHAYQKRHKNLPMKF